MTEYPSASEYVELARSGKDFVAYIVGAILILGFGGNALLRRFSRERVDGRKDKATHDIIGRLERERDEAVRRADRFADERNRMIEQVGVLRGQLGAVQRELDSVRNDAAAMRVETATMRDELALLRNQVRAVKREAEGG